MEITKNTIIDDLVKYRLISALTRNKCVDSYIFTVGDLYKFLDELGSLRIKGLSVRSLSELQEVLYRVKDTGRRPMVVSTKSNQPVGTLSTNEKENISSLENLYESIFLSGGSEDNNNDTLITADSISENSFENEEDNEEEVDGFYKTSIEFSQFFINNKRFPSLEADGDELLLALWYEDVKINKEQFDEEHQDVIDKMIDIEKTYRNILKLI